MEGERRRRFGTGGAWIVTSGSVVLVNDMFEDALAFNQPLAWDMSSVAVSEQMFQRAGKGGSKGGRNASEAPGPY